MLPLTVQRVWLPVAGTATAAELARLRSLSGRDFDVWFLQLMVRHHRGGLSIAGFAAQHGGQGVVRNLADKIVTSETDQV